MSITDAARIDALFKKLQARTNTGKDIGLAAEDSSISHVYSTQMGALPVPSTQPSDAEIEASYPWVKKTNITYNTPLGAPSYRAYKDSRVKNIIPYYTISVSVAGNALSASQYILDFDTGAIVIYTGVAGPPTITFYQYKEDFATPRNLRTEAGKFVTGAGITTSTTDEIDVYNTYYPVFFYVDTYKYGSSSWATKPFSLTIYRARDEDFASRGGMALDVTGTVGLNGASAPSLRWRYSNQAGVTASGGRPNFVGGVELMTKNPGVVVWLRGRCTYRYHGTNLASRVSIQDYYEGATGVRAIANANLGLLTDDPNYLAGVTDATTSGTHSVPYAGAASAESYTGRGDTDAVTAFFRGTTAAWDSVTGLLVKDSVQTAYTVATGSCAPNAVDAFEVGSVLTTTKFEYLPTDIVVQGVSSEFYPVAFTISQTTHDAGSYEINIWRSNVHLDATYRGAVGLEVRGHLFNWGNDADYLNWTYTNRMNSTFTHFVADVQNATFNMAVVIWLRGGGTTYKFSGRGVSSIDSSVTSPKVLAVQSESFSKLTVAGPHFTRNAGQWDSRTNLLILDGVINPPTGLHTDTVGGIATSTTSTSTTALAVNGRTTISTGGLTVSAGGADISGGVTLRGATTVTTGGASITGTTTLAGATTVTTGGLTVSAGGANITGTTTLAGATTVTTGGAKVTGDFYAGNNVRIGSTTSAPTVALDVSGAAKISGALTVGTSKMVQYAAAGGQTLGGATNGTSFRNDGTFIKWSTPSSAPGFVSLDANNMVIKFNESGIYTINALIKQGYIVAGMMFTIAFTTTNTTSYPAGGDYGYVLGENGGNGSLMVNATINDTLWVNLASGTGANHGMDANAAYLSIIKIY